MKKQIAIILAAMIILPAIATTAIAANRERAETNEDLEKIKTYQEFDIVKEKDKQERENSLENRKRISKERMTAGSKDKDDKESELAPISYDYEVPETDRGYNNDGRYNRLGGGSSNQLPSTANPSYNNAPPQQTSGGSGQHVLYSTNSAKQTLSAFGQLGTRPLPQALLNKVPEISKHFSDSRATQGLPLDFNFLLAVAASESGGQNQLVGAASGLYQIENVPSVDRDFANVGANVFGENWTRADKNDIRKSTLYITYTYSKLYNHYNGDHAKIAQALNFSPYSLDKLINKFGDDWMSHRHEMAYYNGVYNQTGNARYGNPKYVERIASFYHDTY